MYYTTAIETPNIAGVLLIEIRPFIPPPYFICMWDAVDVAGIEVGGEGVFGEPAYV